MVKRIFFMLKKKGSEVRELKESNGNDSQPLSFPSYLDNKEKALIWDQNWACAVDILLK